MFTCKRCGYEACTKSNLVRHLRKVRTCKATNNDISVIDYIKELTHKEYNDKTYDCDKCGKRFNSRGNKSRHKKICQGPKCLKTVSQIENFIKENEDSASCSSSSNCSNSESSAGGSSCPTSQNNVTLQKYNIANQSDQLPRHIIEGVSRALTELCQQVQSLSKQLKENDMRVVQLEQLIRAQMHANQSVLIEPSSSHNKKKKKRKIKAALRFACWRTYAGQDVAKTKCFCCRVSEITFSNFHCGHIVSHADGGLATLSNLRPICATCNGSMGRTNMKEFAKDHFDVDVEL